MKGGGEEWISVFSLHDYYGGMNCIDF